MFKKIFQGIHPPTNKHFTAGKPIKDLPLPEKLYISTHQNIGAASQPVVAVGEKVRKGQVIAQADAFVSAPIHAPTSGEIVDLISKSYSPCGECEYIVLQPDFQDNWLAGLNQPQAWESFSSDELKARIQAHGLVGMGGAAFPTHVKLQPPSSKQLEILVVNGAECEPYLTADHRTMLESATELFTGIAIILKILSLKQAYIGIESNKADAIAHLRQLNHSENIQIVELPCQYPQGAEKMLIKTILQREIPSGGLPMDVGVIVQNVSTLVAVARAVCQNIPLIERTVTIAGDCIAEPQNVRARIGTTLQFAIEACGGFTQQPSKILLGGPMMGIAQNSLNVPIIKSTCGILALSPKLAEIPAEHACIRCGSCVTACPMQLLPNMLIILGERRLFNVAKEEYNLLDCIECGCCTFVCPAKRNIVQYIRLLKLLNAQNNK